MLLLSGLLWDYGLEMLRGGYRKLVVAMALLVVVLSLVIVTGLSEGSGLSALDPLVRIQQRICTATLNATHERYGQMGRQFG